MLEPIFEADFDPASYGFRPKRRAQDAITERVAADRGVAGHPVPLPLPRHHDPLLLGPHTRMFTEAVNARPAPGHSPPAGGDARAGAPVAPIARGAILRGVRGDRTIVETPHLIWFDHGSSSNTRSTRCPTGSRGRRAVEVARHQITTPGE